MSNLLGEWHDRILITDKVKDMNIPDKFILKLKYDANNYLEMSKKEYKKLLKTKI